jgi:hypothetical protein
MGAGVALPIGSARRPHRGRVRPGLVAVQAPAERGVPGTGRGGVPCGYPADRWASPIRPADHGPPDAFPGPDIHRRGGRRHARPDCIGGAGRRGAAARRGPRGTRCHDPRRRPGCAPPDLTLKRPGHDPATNGLDHDDMPLSCGNAVRILPRMVHQQTSKSEVGSPEGEPAFLDHLSVICPQKRTSRGDIRPHDRGTSAPERIPALTSVEHVG